MKRILSFSLTALLLASPGGGANGRASASAQETVPPVEWVKLAPQGEEFTATMPRVPFPVAATAKIGDLDVAGQHYSFRGDDETAYHIWSFTAGNLPAALRADQQDYLDACAELAWDLLVQPYHDNLGRVPPEELMKYGMTYDGVLSYADYPGRKYLLRLGGHSGTTQIYAIESRLYIVAAWGAQGGARSVERFAGSFSTPALVVGGNSGAIGAAPSKSSEIAAPPRAADGAAHGSRVEPNRPRSAWDGEGAHDNVAGGEAGKNSPAVDEAKVLTAKDVSQKARLLAKPEPSYTEAARKFGVTGTVRVRAVLSASGAVGKVTPLTSLPHGLTRGAVEAARRIKFEPALKDDRPVSQYVTIEYNFNIY